MFFCFQCRLIVAQMSHTRAEIFNWLLLPTALVVFLSLSFQHQQLELALTYSLLLLATVAHVHYGTCVVSTHLYTIVLIKYLTIHVPCI